MSEKEIEHQESPIWGAFIRCSRIKHKKLEGDYAIKLTAITSVHPVDFEKPKEKECIFYTYKDCSYYAEITPYELITAINSMIFESDKHYESYPD
jgi:hypothetical protein